MNENSPSGELLKGVPVRCIAKAGDRIVRYDRRYAGSIE